MNTPTPPLTNARMVLGDEVVHGTLAVSGGEISDISQSGSSVAEAEDLEGDFLIPGLVELHTDNLERHMMPRPKVFWPATPALLSHDAQVTAAGITTVFDAIAMGGTAWNADRETIMNTSVEAVGIAKSDDVLRADHRLHLRSEVSNPRAEELFERFADDPLVGIVSLMDHTPGQRQFVDLERLKTYFMSRYAMSEGQFEAYLRSKKADQEAHAHEHRQVIAAGARDRGLVLASHDDATEDHVEEAASLGLTIAEFPTTIDAARAAHACGMRTIIGGPNMVRGGSHSGNVSAGDLAKAGLLDAFSSDYIPSSLLHGAMLLHDKHGATLPDAIATVTRNPADMAGLDDRGELRIGARADLARIRSLDDGTPAVLAVWREGKRVI
ncbi:MAG: alpha-D-ribose 1-methylphosphonate 5-triphosphate diphosphatase [Rhodospirillaceae bacterium]|nr:alpha-D-ribose 1-methylphosphonate 5-triphosphate diphosphatase [Rhodospirillaceae bacterium]